MRGCQIPAFFTTYNLILAQKKVLFLNPPTLRPAKNPGTLNPERSSGRGDNKEVHRKLWEICCQGSL